MGVKTIAMKRFLFILIFMLLEQGFAYAQLKTYNGPFEDGHANYTYKEEGVIRIFNGRFSYKSGDGKKSMSGKYIDDMKTGLWTVNWYGFHEEINYKQGFKHGNYLLRYKDSYNEMKIDAHFTEGELDSLYFWMKAPGGYVIAGHQYNSPETIDCWFRGIDGKYICSQYFYQKTFVGSTVYDYSTGDWGEYTTDDIRDSAHFLDSLSKNNYKYAGKYYLLEPQKENMFYKQLCQNGDIFSCTPNWLNEIAYFFIYDFHAACFGSSLWRGEVLYDDYTLCFTIKEDEARMKAEKEREEKERKEIERKKKIYAEKLAKRTATFNQTEYGKFINYLKPYVKKSDSLFEQAKHNYIQSRLKQYRLASHPINIENELKNPSEVLLRFKYSKGNMNNHNCGIISMAYHYNIPDSKELKDFSVIIIPTTLVLINNQWSVSDAIIVYYHNKIKANTYLQNYYNEIKLGPQGFLIKGSLVSITNDYIFNYKSNSYAMKPITPDTRYKKSQIYYDIWHNPQLSKDDFIQSITKEEVTKPIEVRFNIKKEE